MSVETADRRRTLILLCVAVGAVVVAAAMMLLRNRDPGPDAATKAAIEKNATIQANTQQQPATPDLPVESRAPRGVVKQK